MRRVIFALLPLLLAGCSIGSRAIRKNYADYNQSLHYNQSQEMLLNVVRLRYRETPLFLKLGALTTSYSYGTSGSIDGGHRFGEPSYGGSLGADYSERPTVSYSPLEGNTFVRQLLAELDRSTFVLLLRSGWPLRLLCNVMVERIGDVVNDPDSASHSEFSALVDALDEAQDLGHLEAVEIDEESFLKLQTPLADLRQPEQRSTELHEHIVPLADFQLRSLLDVMFFLGQNTEVPPEHMNQVRQATKNGLMDVRWHQEQPTDALVWVRHNGVFFSIGRTDVGSKDTFALLKLLFELQAGDIEAVKPVLTLSAD